MTEEETLTPADEEITDLVDAPQDARQEAFDRAQQCAAEVQEILEKHRCRIMPRIDISDIEPVGLAGNKIQIASTYWIAPVA